MSKISSDRPFRNISDTARFVALLRAFESERPDALFHDRHARALAQGDDPQTLRNMLAMARNSRFDSRAMAVRTQVIDELIEEAISKGVDTILNLAAGLDTRPYRMHLADTLTWVEADLPGILSYKEQRLSDETPRCRLRRIKANLTDPRARRDLFTEVNATARRALVLTEGLLMYLKPQAVEALGNDLASYDRFDFWVTDLLSPEELRWLQDKYGKYFDAANSTVYFAPADPDGFFLELGWNPVRFYSYWEEAPRLNRESTRNRLLRYIAPVAPRAWLERHRKQYGIQLLSRAPGRA